MWDEILLLQYEKSYTISLVGPYFNIRKYYCDHWKEVKTYILKIFPVWFSRRNLISTVRQYVVSRKSRLYCSLVQNLTAKSDHHKHFARHSCWELCNNGVLAAKVFWWIKCYSGSNVTLGVMLLCTLAVQASGYSQVLLEEVTSRGSSSLWPIPKYLNYHLLNWS